jgi:SAM-dependent methyltransferase
VYGVDAENIVQIIETANDKDISYYKETSLPLPAMDLSHYSGTDNYSDGDVEERILNYICNNEPEHYSDIFKNDREWAVFYHLTQYRKNLLNWYTFKEGSSLLEIGAGMGGLTSLFCERCAHVTAVEMSKRRAQAIQIRCRNQKNLDIVVGDFTKTRFERKYDYVTVIGVLEYQSVYGKGDTPQLDFLKALRGLLAPGGKLIVAIENKFGLKYWTGEGDDHSGIPFGSINDFAYGGTARTFDRQELSALLAEAGFQKQKFYYPLPDYKLPRLIYSDRYFNADILSEACPLYYDRNQYGEIPVVVDEARVREPIMRNGVFPFFANSFLVECLFDGGNFDDTVFASVQAGLRAEKYQIITRFDGKQFIKSAVSPEVVPHIQQCYDNIVEFQNHGIPVVEHNYQQGIITMLTVSSETADRKFINMLRKNDLDGAKGMLDRLYGYILQSSEEAEAKSNYLLETGLVPEGETPDFGVILKTAYCDMTLFNCFCQGDDFLFFDQEWKFSNLPASYVLFRTIAVIYGRNQFLEGLCPIQHWKTQYSLETLWSLYVNLESKLLSPVFNTECSVIISLANMPPDMIQNNITLLRTGHERLRELDAILNSRTYRTMKILYRIAKKTGVLTVLKGILKIRRILLGQK